MRLIIAGSRTIADRAEVAQAVKAALRTWGGGRLPTTVLSGDAKGVDRLGAAWAREHRIPVEVFLPDWARYGRVGPKNAGYRRNEEMAKCADALVAIWDGKSQGTAHMLLCMQRLGKPTWTHLVKQGGPMASVEALL